jgi:hypothetical protein
MRLSKVVLLLIVSTSFVVVSCIQSEISWAAKDAGPNLERAVAQLPNIAVGNLSTYVRSGGLEVMCTSLYDVPGGYCFYFTPGVSILLGGGID